ncbi:MAG: fumarate hydratase, partial [Betaproteobacteria bacterium]|nr:fumarate hydratase [Betaproteobacteria bacterium]
MTVIREDDLIQSIADAFQYISYYHPPDYIRALGAAYEREESVAARDAIAQILTNSRMSAEGKRPMCQDTGTAIVKAKKGQRVFTGGGDDEAISRGIYNTYQTSNLRYSQLAPLSMFEEVNTDTNLPAE